MECSWLGSADAKDGVRAHSVQGFACVQTVETTTQCGGGSSARSAAGRSVAVQSTPRLVNTGAQFRQATGSLPHTSCSSAGSSLLLIATGLSPHPEQQLAPDRSTQSA